MALDFQPVDFQPSSEGVDFKPIDFQPMKQAPKTPGQEFMGDLWDNTKELADAARMTAGGFAALPIGALHRAYQGITNPGMSEKDLNESNKAYIQSISPEPWVEEKVGYADAIGEGLNQLFPGMMVAHTMPPVRTAPKFRKPGPTLDTEAAKNNWKEADNAASKADGLGKGPVDFKPIGDQMELPFTNDISESPVAKAARETSPQGDLFEAPRGDLGLGFEEARAREIDDSIARTQKYMDERNQGLIDDTDQGYMANQYGGGQDGLRYDEHGIPIRADRSMEAANLENPLQRNLWGDELPRQSAQEAPRGITAAMDRMDPVARTEAIREQFMPPKGQRGAVHEDLLGLGITDKMVDLFKRYREVAGRLGDQKYMDVGSTGNKAAHTRAFNNLVREIESQNVPLYKAIAELNRVADAEGLSALGGTQRRLPKGQRGAIDLKAIEMAFASARKGRLSTSKLDITTPENAQRFVEKAMRAWQTPNLLELQKAIENHRPQSYTLEKLAKEVDTELRMRSVPKGQRGAIDAIGIAKGLAELKRGAIDKMTYFKRFKGAFDSQEMDFMERQLRNPNSRETIMMLSPDDFHNLASKRDAEYLATQEPKDLRDSIKRGLKSPEGLKEMPQLWVDINKDSGVAQVIGHEGRHRMDVFKEQGVGLVPVRIKSTEGFAWGKDQHPREFRPEGLERDFANIPSGEPLHQSMRIPQSQRGAIDLGPSKTNPEVTNLKADDPAVKAAKEEIIQNKKKALAAKMTGNPYVDNITTPAQVIAAIKDGAKDMGKATVERMKSVGAGINSVALSSNNPLIKLARYLYRTADKKAESLARQYITSEETGIAHTWHELSRTERNEVAEVWHKQDKEQRWFSEEQLRGAGYNDKQIEIINKQREMEKVKLRIWNEELAKQGKEPVEERPGHFPGRFSGDFRTLVLEKKGDKWSPVGYVGANTRVQHDNLVAKLKEEHPDRRYDQLPPRRLGGMSSRAHEYGLNELAKVLAEHDEAFGELLQKADAITAEKANDLYGAGKHALDKKGIFGSEGNKPWLDKTKNTEEMFQAYISYWDEGIRSHLNMPVEVELKSLMNNPELANMRNAKEYLRKYMLHATGRSASEFGGAVDMAIGAAARKAWPGIGPSLVRNAFSETSKRIGQKLMGFGNIWHTAVQFLQVPTNAYPQFANIIGQFHLNPAKFVTSQKAGVADTFAMKMGRKVDDPYKQASIDYARHMGLDHFSEFQDLSEVGKGKAGRLIDNIIDFNRTVAEVSTRPFVFFTIADALKNEPHLTMEQKLSAAYNATQEAMIDYAPREKPMVYRDLGQMGKLSGSLATYKHGSYAQYGRLIKNAAKGNPGGVAGLAIAIGMMYALAGVRGIIGYQDADAIVKGVTGMMGKRQSIRELLLDPNIQSEVVKSGALSAGFDLDLSNRIAVAGVIPESIGELAAGPFGTHIGQLAGDAVAVAKDPLSKLDWKNLAIDLLPNGPFMKGAVKEKLMGDEDTGRLDDKHGLPGNERTKSEQTKNFAGIQSLRQANLNESQYNDLRRQLDDRDAQKEIIERTKKYISQGQLTPERAKEFFNKYQEHNGTPDKWKQAFTKEEFNLNLNKQERLEGILRQESLESIYQYMNYERSRKKLNGYQQ